MTRQNPHVNCPDCAIITSPSARVGDKFWQNQRACFCCHNFLKLHEQIPNSQCLQQSRTKLLCLWPLTTHTQKETYHIIQSTDIREITCLCDLFFADWNSRIEKQPTSKGTHWDCGLLYPGIALSLTLFQKQLLFFSLRLLSIKAFRLDIHILGLANSDSINNKVGRA